MNSHRRAFNVIALAAIASLPQSAFCANSQFDDVRAQQVIHGDAARGAAKALVCAACHGAQGIAVAPAFPDLAGQSSTYLYIQLRAFKRGARDNAVMKPLASALSDQDMRDVAAHFASLPRKPAIATSENRARGDVLFHEGDPAKGIPPCQGCHGPDGRGPQPQAENGAPQPPWATFPALAGQNAPYVVEQLKAFRDGTRAGLSNDKVMQGVTRNLDDADAQALATYLATQ